MTTPKEKTAATEAIRNMTDAFEPWINATKAWTAETEKFSQTAVEGIGHTLDNVHKLAKESLAMAYGWGEAMRKQTMSQVERTMGFFNSFHG